MARHFCASPISALAILERLSPFTTVYVRSCFGSSDTEEEPLCTSEKSGSSSGELMSTLRFPVGAHSSVPALERQQTERAQVPLLEPSFSEGPGALQRPEAAVGVNPVSPRHQQPERQG